MTELNLSPVTRAQRLLHIAHARQDEAWVHGVLLPGLGLDEGGYWTRAEDDLGALKVEQIEQAVLACRYTLLVASSAGRVDQWAQFASVLAQHLGIEEDKPRLLLVTRDFEPGSPRAHELLPLRQRCLVSLDCSNADRTRAALTNLAAQLALTVHEEPPRECPYPGLRMFGSEEPGGFTRTDLFFGRDDEGRQILEQLRDHSRVLLVGPSGCGKSSLVRARVLPALRRHPEAMAVAVARPGGAPDAALRAALDALDPRLGPAIDAYLRAAEDDEPAARVALAAAAGESRRLLYVDQLEEAFLEHAGSISERAAFFARLGALNHVPGVGLLLGMRADFYADLMRSPLWEAFRPHRVELAPLRGAALRLAITRPAEVVGVHVEADLVERLAREAELDRAAEALPLLQVALEQLWHQREWRYLSLDSYRRMIGADAGTEDDRRGLDVVLAGHADTTVAALAEPWRVLARRVLLDLVHLGEGRPDTRRRRSEADLQRVGDDVVALTQVIAHLSVRRLISVGAEAATAMALLTHDAGAAVAERQIDLAHDALITGWPTLTGWIAEHRDRLRTQRRLEARAASGGLLSGAEFAEFLSWLAWIETAAGQALGATEALRALVRRSVALRRMRRIAAAGGVLATIAVAIVFGVQAERLRDEKAKTQQSIGEAMKVADMIVFEVDRPLEELPGAAPIRERLLASSRDLVERLRRIGELSVAGERTAMGGKLADAQLALERGQFDLADALYRGALVEAQARAAADPTNADWQRDLGVVHTRLGDVEVRTQKLDNARQSFLRALAIRETLATGAPGNAQRQRDLCSSYEQLGDVATATGSLPDARGFYERALAVLGRLAAAAPDRVDLQHELIAAHDRLGDVAMKAGDLAEARRSFEAAAAASRTTLGLAPSNSESQRGLAVALIKLGDVATRSGKFPDARGSLEQSLAIISGLVARDPGNTDWQRDLVVANLKLAEIALSTRAMRDAKAGFERAFALASALAATAPSNTEWQRDVSVAELGLGDLATTSREHSDARAHYEHALDLRRALATLDAGNTAWQRDLAVAYDRLADLTAAEGKLVDALAMRDRALAIIQDLVTRDPKNTDWQRDLSVACERLGELSVDAGDLIGARRNLERARMLAEQLVAQDPGNGMWQRDLFLSYTKLAEFAELAGNRVDARALYDHAQRVRAELLAKGTSEIEWQRDMAVSYERRGDLALRARDAKRAAALLDRALASRQAVVTADPASVESRRDLALAHMKRAEVAAAVRQPERARQQLDRARTLLQALTEKSGASADLQRDLAECYDRLGEIAIGTNDPREARRSFTQSLAIAKALATANPANTDLLRDLAVAYVRLGDVETSASAPEEAHPLLAQARAIAESLVAKDPSNPEWQRDLSVYEQRLAEVEVTNGSLQAALSLYRHALAIIEALAARRPNDVQWQRDLCISLVLTAQVEQDKAARTTLLERATRIYRNLERKGALGDDKQFRQLEAELVPERGR